MPRLWLSTIETHRAAVRDAILDAAMGLVADRGLRSVTMADIALRAGIGRATLYKYFGDADAIVRAWHDREVDRHMAEVLAIKDGPGDAGSRLAAVLEQYGTSAQTGRGAHDSELSAMLHRDEHVVGARHRLRGVVAELIAAAVAEGAVRDDIGPDELAAYCLAALSAAAHLHSRAAVRRLVQLTLTGMRPSARPG